jgi:hypothetical protein
VRFFRVISQVKWLNSEQTNILRIISAGHNPEDENRDGPQNGGLFTVQPLDPADNPKNFTVTIRQKSARKLKYLGTTVKNQKFIHEEIKSKLNSGNACYHPLQSLLSSRLLPQNFQIKIYKTIFFTCCFVWVVSHTKGRTQIQDVRE